MKEKSMNPEINPFGPDTDSRYPINSKSSHLFVYPDGVISSYHIPSFISYDLPLESLPELAPYGSNGIMLHYILEDSVKETICQTNADLAWVLKNGRILEFEPEIIVLEGEWKFAYLTHCFNLWAARGENLS